MSWNHRLKEIMDQRGMKMAELSRRAGVPYDSVTKYLRGSVTNPRGDIVEKLAAALGVSSSYLRYGEFDPSGVPTPLQAAPAAKPTVPEPPAIDMKRLLMDVAWDAAARVDEDVFEGRCMPREKAQIFAVFLECLEGAVEQITASPKAPRK